MAEPLLPGASPTTSPASDEPVIEGGGLIAGLSTADSTMGNTGTGAATTARSGRWHAATAPATADGSAEHSVPEWDANSPYYNPRSSNTGSTSSGTHASAGKPLERLLLLHTAASSTSPGGPTSEQTEFQPAPPSSGWTTLVDALKKESALQRVKRRLLGLGGPRSLGEGGRRESNVRAFTSDGRKVTHVGSMVVLSKPATPPKATAAGGPALGCFVRELSGKDGVNCTVMHPSGRVVITGGSEKASRGMMAPESGWLQTWERAEDNLTWSLANTMTGNMFADHMTESNCEQGPGIEEEDTFGNILPPVTAAATHPHLATAATGHGSPAGSAKGGGCFVIIWCMASHAMKRLLRGHTGEVTSVVFHETRPWVASGSKGSTIRLWNWDTGDLVYAVEAHEGGVTCLMIHSFIRDYSRMMAEQAPSEAATPTTQDDGLRSKSHRMVKNFVRKSKSAVEKVSEWDGLYWTFDNKRSAGAYSAFDHKVHRTMMMGEDGKQKLPEDLVITCGDDRTVALWSMDTGELVRRMCGHQREITDLALFKGSCPEGDMLASSSFDRTVRIWHLTSGACTRVLRHNLWVLCVDFHKDGLLAAGCAGGVVNLWDTDSGSMISTFQSGSRAWLKSINFVCGQDHIITLSLEGRMSIWEYKTCPSSVYRLEAPVPEGERPSSMQHNLVVTPDGTLAASSDHEYVVTLWDLATGRVLHTLGDKRPSRNKLLRHFTTGLAFSPCKGRLAVGAADEVARVYNVCSGRLLAELCGHTGRVCSTAFHPDGAMLATSSVDTTVRLWDAQSWECLRTLDCHREWVTTVAFSPDGAWLASGGWDDRLLLYHLGKKTFAIKECYSNIWTIAWQPRSSADDPSTQVSVGTAAGMLHHFQLDEMTQLSWKETGSVLAHEEIVSSIAWDAEGYFMLSSSLDNSVKLWGAPKSAMDGKDDGKKNTKRVIVPIEQYALFAKFPCAVMSVTWTAQPPSRLHQGDAGLMVGLCTTTAGMYIMDGSAAGQSATPYFRTKFLYDHGGPDALREMARMMPLSLSSMGPGGQTIMHDIVTDVSLLQDCLKMASEAGIKPNISLGTQPMMAEAYAASELAVGACVDSVMHVVQAEDGGAPVSFINDVGTATLLMLITGYSEQAARLLAATGLHLANDIVYADKWRNKTPRLRMKPGSVVTRGSSSQFPEKIWGPHTVHRHPTEREIDVVAAVPTFQYAAGIPPGMFQFDQGFSMGEDERNSGLERSVLHLAFNKGAMEILDTPIGRAILDYKWVTYGRKAYYRSMITPMLLIVFTTVMSVSLYMTQTLGRFHDASGDESVVRDIVTWSRVSQVASVLCGTNAIWMLLQELGQFFKEGWALYLGNGWNLLDVAVIAMCMASSASALGRVSIERGESESMYHLDLGLAWAQFACMTCWLEVFNILRADSRFGLIVRMIINIANDIKYLIFLQAFLCLGSTFSFLGVWRPSMEAQVACPTLWQDLWNTMLRVYAMLLGNIDLEVFETAEYDVFYQIMFLAFVYMQTVLLLNLVIAMMGESFEKVLQAAQKELTADRAELLIRVELSLGVQRMRSRGYLPRYLQVLIPKAELTSTYNEAVSGGDSEWAGVAGTVTNNLAGKLKQQSDLLLKHMHESSGKKIDSVTHNLMTMKKDLKDHMNSLEERLIGSGGNAAAVTGSDVILRQVVREELAQMLRQERDSQAS